jgi:hypothetical protein
MPCSDLGFHHFRILTTSLHGDTTQKTTRGHILQLPGIKSKKDKVLKHHTMNVCGGVEIKFQALVPVLNGGEWSASCSGFFTSREMTNVTHWIGGWVSPRAGLDMW